MKLEFVGNRLIVTKEAHDPKYYGRLQAKGESHLLYAIKTQLNAEGWNVIKKRMWHDGHLVDDCQQYITTRKRGAGKNHPDVYIYNDCFMLWGADEKFNQGEVRLCVQYDIFADA